jgi:DNA-binding winged helix-turn-helix (wHTH) protein/predicted ATPase
MSRSVQQWCFGPFRLDPAAACLWHADRLLPLPPKPFAVLAYLVTHAGEVVSKEMLLDAGWPETIVTEGVLKTCMVRLRQVLGETARDPQYITTVHGRGYRFIAPVTPASLATPASSPLTPSETAPVFLPAAVEETFPLIVDREAELAQLHKHFRQAAQGQRQVVFITGEAGIGKTTLVDAFVSQVAPLTGGWIGRGQCIEQYGVGEAYLPLLDALGQLGRGSDGRRLVELLHRQAPNWLLQLPALVDDNAYEALQRRTIGATRERMLRELAEAIEMLTTTQALLLVLEDLHWSDVSTMEWLAYMARRRSSARLLILGTYRPVEAIVHGHPVHAMRHDLEVHGQGAELSLGYLSVAGVATYLTQRMEGPALPAELAPVLHQRTTGNPLFLVTVVDELIRQGLLRSRAVGGELVGGLEAAAVEIPVSVQQVITQQVERCAPVAQAVLEAASVAGTEFPAAAVAAGMEQAVETVEAHCEVFARRGQFLQALDPTAWPDGTVTACYRFRHDLYREVLYERVPVSRRARWHRQIGVRLETGYGVQSREIATELAEHFVRGRDTERAVRYLREAGQQALQRSAHQEAILHLTRGLELLATLPETLERAQLELDLQVALGPALITTKSQGASEVEQTYARARVLCTQVGETPQLLPTLQGLCDFYRNRGELSAAREIGEQLLRLAQRTAEPTFQQEAHAVLGQTLFHVGEYEASRMHLEQAAALTAPTAQHALVFRQDAAPGVRCLALLANTLWCLGYPAQAVQRSQEALALAQTLGHPYSLGMARYFTVLLHARRREPVAVQAHANALLALASEQGFPLYVGFGTCLQGWAFAMQGQDEGGETQLRHGMATVLATGQTLSRPLWQVLLAEAVGHVGQVEKALGLLGEALAAFEASGRGDMLAEAYRLRGECLMRQGVPAAALAEACFQQALTIARRQQAKSWELRAVMSLSRLWQHEGKRAEARALLAPIFNWFTEGFDTADLKEAKVLLAELSC